jgi:hypothetical protein
MADTYDYDFIPTFHFAENSLSTTRSDLAAQAENTTRDAVVNITHISKGAGQQRVGPVVAFPVVFREVPHFACGSAVISNPDQVNWQDPVGSSGITGWQVDDRGYYTGAFIWVRVDLYPVNSADTTLTPPVVQVEHHLSFTGKAIKDLRGYQNASLLSDMTPRIVGI